MIARHVKRFLGIVADGLPWSAHPELAPLDLDAHWPHLEALMAAEEWPFVRADLEVGHAQPRAVGRVAFVDDACAGFFATHHFGDVGYLDMLVVDQAWRGRSVARPLYFSTVNALKRRGMGGFVAHTTHDSARIIGLLGFRPGAEFALLARDPRPAAPADGAPGTLRHLGAADLAEAVALDAAVFGLERPTWIASLSQHAELLGLERDGALVACLALRPRQGDALCLDAIAAPDPADAVALVRAAVAAHPERRLECFARCGSAVEDALRELGFAVPDFFTAIGPLVEWRKGDTAGVGDGERIECLMWL